MSNNLDHDQARRFVGPDLGPNCLPKLSADDTGRQRVRMYAIYICVSSKLHEHTLMWTECVEPLQKLKARLAVKPI